MDGHKERVVKPGEYDVPQDYSKEVATMVVKHKCAKWVREKVAPENKVAEPEETKLHVVSETKKKRGRKKRSIVKGD